METKLCRNCATRFLTSARERSLHYRHNHILIPFGCDFAHQNAYQSMIQMDKLMSFVNNNSSFNTKIIYSTLADYTLAVNQLNLTWKLEQPEFFTYIEEPHAWWSGYFTSRSDLKLFVRSRQVLLRMAEQSFLFAKNLNYFSTDSRKKSSLNSVDAMRNITFLRSAIDVTQHHDAITGTEKQSVAQSYLDQLQNGTEMIDNFLGSVIGYFLQKNNDSLLPPKFDRNVYDLFSQLNDNNFVVQIVYNSLAWQITQYLQIPTNRSDLYVIDAKGMIIPSQINPCNIGEISDEINGYPSKYNLFIYAKLPPLSFVTYFIGANESKAVLGKVVNLPNNMKEDVIVGDTQKSYYSMTFSSETNRLSSITNNKLNQTWSVENQFVQYVPSGGVYSDHLPNSGAYIFRPAQNNRYRLKESLNRTKKETIVFRRDGIISPGFLTLPHCGREVDSETFIATVCDLSESENSFSLNYYITNGVYHGWYQRPYFDFVVFDQNNNNNRNTMRNDHDLFYQTLTGSEAIEITNGSSSDIVKVVINFKDNFPSDVLPELLVSVRDSQCDDKSQYVSIITDISYNSATIYVKRVTSKNNEWSQSQIYFDWVSYDPSKRVQNKFMINGQKNIQIDHNQEFVHVELVETFKTQKTTLFVPEEPVILVSIQQISEIKDESDLFFGSMTTYLTTNESFILNIYPEHDKLTESESISLQITYWSFERETLSNNVSENDSDISNTLISGPLIDEMQQFFRKGYSQTFRVFNTMNENNSDLFYISNKIHLGPIDEGSEFVTRFNTDLNNLNHVWYTNQNGLEYVQRKYHSIKDERISGNYFPSTSQTYIEDNVQKIRFSTIVNQAHGVGSTELGEFEIMLQRRCLSDDGRGVGEVLNASIHSEPEIIILMDNNENVSNLNRRLYQMQQFSSVSFFTLTDSWKEWISFYNTSWTAMNDIYSVQGLPEQIFLMQLRYGYSAFGDDLNSGQILQFHHMFEQNESSLAYNVSLDLHEIFNDNVLKINNQSEMTLTSNIALKDLHRISWNVEMENGDIQTIRNEFDENQRRKKQFVKDQDSVIMINPRQIRTFVVNQ